MIQTTSYQSPIGLIGLAANDEGIIRVFFDHKFPFDEQIKNSYPGEIIQHTDGDLFNAKKQLDGYFSRKRSSFNLPLILRTSPFSRATLNIVSKIPYGYTLTYKDVAIQAGNPKAARAVGRANATNPIPIFIPCHRVLAADGTMHGYGGGLDKKEFLLKLEGAL